MITIPLSAVPSQMLTVTLNGKSFLIMIYTLGADNRLYFDIYNQGEPILTCVICQDRVKLIQLEYLGFTGDLSFIDTQGLQDPIYTGLGSRYLLVYLP